MAYFSNGTEGMILDEQCSECKIPDDAPCPILLVHLLYNYEQVGNDLVRTVLNDLVNESGQCQMKPLIDTL